LTKIRTYGSIVSVRNGGTVQGRIRENAASAGAGGERAAASRSTRFNRDDLPSSAITTFRKDFTADCSGFGILHFAFCILHFLSVVQLLCSRLAALNSLAFAPGFAGPIPIKVNKG
jgi:hypothetical protein